ncbi:MAG: hypothetical protein O3B84_06770 [Chloroflexi bacterium]|nr:hypothetical protein [Chloroflexota bacterium]
MIDEYLYCDANAQAASAYLDAWWILGRPDCRDRAQGLLEFIWERFRDPDGGMFHVLASGMPKVPGMLSDATYAGLAFLDGFALLGHEGDRKRAEQIGEDIVRRHRSVKGGFFDIADRGPARTGYPMAVLTQNATAASFFIRLADLGGQAQYRELAHWALKDFPNTHRAYGAFAAGYGHALARLLAPPLVLNLSGTPGHPQTVGLARAALTQLGHANMVIKFAEAPEISPQAAVTLERLGETIGPITDASRLVPSIFTG